MQNNAGLIRKGAIAELKERLNSLDVKAEGLCKLIAQEVFVYDGLDNVDINAVKVDVAALDETLIERKKVREQLKKLEES